MRIGSPYRLCIAILLGFLLAARADAGSFTPGNIVVYSAGSF